MRWLILMKLHVYCIHAQKRYIKKKERSKTFKIAYQHSTIKVAKKFIEATKIKEEGVDKRVQSRLMASFKIYKQTMYRKNIRVAERIIFDFLKKTRMSFNCCIK
jgi:poly(3-hydroxyalkanoate) synthetase